MAGDDTTALDAVLQCDTERLMLLEEEAQLMEQLSAAQHGEEGQADGQRQQQGAAPPAANGSAPDAGSDGLAVTQRLAAIGKRLHEIGAWACMLCASSTLVKAHCCWMLEPTHLASTTLAAFVLLQTNALVPQPLHYCADAYGAQARAAAILAGLSFTPDMQVLGAGVRPKPTRVQPDLCSA